MRQRILVAAFLLPVLASCAASDTPYSGRRDAEQRDGASAVLTEANASVPRPIDALLFLEYEDERALYLATELATQECMEEQGFEYPFSPFPAAEKIPVLDQPYGVTDIELARVFGYAPGPLEEGFDPQDSALSRYVSRLSNAEAAAWSLALSGSGDARLTVELANGAVVELPVDGCRADAERLVEGDRRNHTLLLGQLYAIRDEARAAALGDRRVRGVFEEWSDCMQKRGYAFRTPLDPYDVEGLGPSAQIEMAVADVGCKEEAGVVTVWSSVEAEYQLRLLEQHAGLVETWSEVRQSQIERAKALQGLSQSS